MSVLEILIYSIMGAVILFLVFKWFIYDTKIKPKRQEKKLGKEKTKIPSEDEDEN